MPTLMERVGSGIRLMLNETRRMGLPPPQFREMSEFVVTFLKVPVVTPEAPSPEETLWDSDTFSEEGQQDISTETSRFLEQEQRMQQAMQYVREHGMITNTLYRDLTGISEATARRDLETLVERGTLRGTGKTRGKQYRLP